MRNHASHINYNFEKYLEGPAFVSEVESRLTEGRDAGVAVQNRFVVTCWCDLYWTK